MCIFLVKMLCAVGAAILMTTPFSDVHYSYCGPDRALIPGAGVQVVEASAPAWTMDNLRKLARDERMTAVVSSLSGKPETGKDPPILHLRVKEAIDASSDANIRKALLEHADGRGAGDDLFAFANTNNAAATCSAVETVAGFGLEVCSARCAEKGKFRGRRKTPESCYTLCSLAVAPCGSRPFNSTVFLQTGIANTIHAFSIGGKRFRTLFLRVIPAVVGVVVLITWTTVASVSVAAYKTRLGRMTIAATVDLLPNDVRITLCLGILALLGIVGFRKARARGAAAGGGREAPRMTGVA